ncbi:oleandomycin transport system permease protein [Saccharopolyspora erythraea NRRL 2338]|uniref:Transport permease protein n=2 Tax=Saccharopolyspora erythraea TaxID=1836 RepID=A4F6U7_SACEN|nr:ABC transporter permease [Saccharopolyspora erythraea]EQD81858.1 ABC transporter [Saccharopolyspora erythraea D]PFG93573.1 oleandomycin transport system permease protein [Saccharopolyspora erythraea NRRL 2338]QRK90422.1 ABC transporter permease [Saccharopolyspora erythraea]CAL99771.1 multidrug ABC transporter permease [Saccharopolyspora erythraea NRRL 2338]
MTTTLEPTPGATSAAPAPAAERVGPLRAVRHGLTLAGRSILKIRKSPAGLLDVTLQPILFLVMFVYLFGGAISGDTGTYLQITLPGVLAMNMVFASLGTGMQLNTDITKGVFDRFRSLPVARSAPLIGAVLGDIVRYVVSIAVLLVFGTIMGFRIQTDAVSALLAVVVVIAFSLAMCWISVFLGMLIRSQQALPGVAMSFMFPLTMGSNVFVPLETMPGWLQAWNGINPVTKLADTARGLMIGGPVAGPLTATLIWMVVLVAVFFPLAMWAYRRRV